MGKTRYVVEQTSPGTHAGKSKQTSANTFQLQTSLPKSALTDQNSISGQDNGTVFHTDTLEKLPSVENNKAGDSVSAGHQYPVDYQYQPRATQDGVPGPSTTFTSANSKANFNDVEGTRREDSQDEEQTTGGKHKGDKPIVVGMFGLFRFASGVEIMMIIVGTVATITAGLGIPTNFLILGELITVFVVDVQKVNKTDQGITNSAETALEPFIIRYVLLGSVTFLSCYVAISFWMWAGERQIKRIRKLFFRAVLRQDIGWFDTYKVTELNSRFSEDIHQISEGIEDKMAVFIQWCTTGVACYTLAFFKLWKLALVASSFSPLYVLFSVTTARLTRSMALKEGQTYAKAGAVAEQALRAIRTVHVFQGQQKEEKKYGEQLELTKKVAKRKGLVLGAGSGVFLTTFFISFGVVIYYGIILINNEGAAPGDVVVVLFGILVGTVYMGSIVPNIEIFSKARVAAATIFEIIDLRSRIDITSTAGKIPKTLNGVIEFKDVHFNYPARPDVQVLRGLNLRIETGQIVALVGSSGCGKSTAIQLLQRFYDPARGQVCLDGNDIKDLNLKWLRDQIGVVSQEPVLFAASIGDNIRYGLPGASQQQVEAAAVQANAHEFIRRLPEGYNTMVGERGTQLSGGQKQRLAIARALIKNPRILLLDEATSALDHESEALVQNALEKAEEGRTTLVIAHRLSTIRNADLIVTLSHGASCEEGTHEQLMLQNGQYAQLVAMQSGATEADNECDEKVVSDAGEDSHLIVPATHSRQRHISDRAADTDVVAALEKRVNLYPDTDDDDDDEEEEKDEEVKEQKPVSMKRLLKLCAPEWVMVTFGTIVSMLCGMIYPFLTFMFSEFLKVLTSTDEDEQFRQTAIISGVMASMGVLNTVFRIISGYCFSTSGAAMTARLRSQAFSSMLKQDMSFFDDRKNQVGGLTACLSKDAVHVQGATGIKLASVLEGMATIITGMTIAFIFGWKLTLVILTFLPITLFAGKIQGKVIAGSARSEKSTVLEAGKVSSEAIENIRTVVSLSREDIFIDKIENLLDRTSSTAWKTRQVFGLTYGFSNSIQFFAIIATFAYGMQLIDDKEMEFFGVFRVLGAVISSGNFVGRNMSYGMDFSKARVAAARLFSFIDRQPKIDVNSAASHRPERYSGRVSFDNVGFSYPSRDTALVLSGLTLNIQSGETVALVGTSGCGKSTVMNLLQRFYDPDTGAVLVDDRDLKTVDLKWFRQQVGIVSQEPALFDDTIAANIAYGDNNRHVTMEEIIAVARAANIHVFIDSLPQGYDTQLGDKGTQLSGGQKQRIAIARALVRKPKVLLLDEATSALDTESERVVQDALDQAREGRTCIIIAHRLTTIRNADRIAVMAEGRVLEIGNHASLMQKKGAYARLLEAQYGFKNSLPSL